MTCHESLAGLLGPMLYGTKIITCHESLAGLLGLMLYGTKILRENYYYMYLTYYTTRSSGLMLHGTKIEF